MSENRLHVLEYLSLFACLSTRIFVEYFDAAIWLGVVITALFGVLYGVFFFKRKRYAPRKVVLLLAIWAPLYLIYIYVAFFLK